MRAECHGRPGTWQDRARAGRAGHCSRGRSQFHTGWEKSREAGKGGSSWHVSIQQRVKLRLQSMRAAVPTPTASTPQWRQLPRQADHLSVGLIWPLFPSHSQASLSKGWPLLSARWECACRRASGRAQGSHKGPAQHPAAPLSWPSQVLFSPRGTYPVESLVSGLSGTSEMTCTAPCPCLSQGRAVTPCRHSLRDGPGQASGLRSLHSVPLKPLLGARGLPRSQG